LNQSKPLQRKLLAARLDLADKISELALNRKGTLYDYINEILEQTIKIESMGLSLKEISNEMSVFKGAKDVGFVLIPEVLVIGLTKKAFEKDDESLKRLFFENGQWYGEYYGSIGLFTEIMKKYLWSASEFDIKKTGKNVVLSCLGKTFPESYSELLGYFFEGAMDSLDYCVKSKNVSKGIIHITFHPKED
jgi:hypothetical protein